MKIVSQTIMLMIIASIALNTQVLVAEQSLNESLSVDHGWVRLTPPVAKNGAAYFTLHNRGTATIKVTDVATEIAETAAMHAVEIDKSMVKMVHLEQLEIPAGEKVVFAPGGKHLMLINLQQKLAEDMEVEINFTLETGEIIVAKMPVTKHEPAVSEEPSVHQHQH